MASLFIVATPIGNLGDITLRAIQTLKDVDAILCEDTRVTMKLLARLEIKKPLMSFHEHSDRKRLDDIVNRLREGKSLALVTDAGTPAISDPGAWLVREVIEQLGADVAIVSIPGPSAVVTALAMSGFYGDEFVFMGFPPHKKGRQGFFDRVAKEDRIVVLYESTHRIMKAMEELSTRIDNRQIMLCRELTKLHETTYRGTATEVTIALKTGSIKGEFVIVLAAV